MQHKVLECLVLCDKRQWPANDGPTHTPTLYSFQSLDLTSFDGLWLGQTGAYILGCGRAFELRV